MRGTLVARDLLTPGQGARMLQILQRNFQHISEERFRRDLEEKNWIILVLNDAGRIVGFSTLHFHQAHFDGEPIAVVYSGDTIVERESWGSSALLRTWLHTVWQLHAGECPELPLYWLLLTSGFRTYRFLSVFWHEFHPSCRGTMPANLQRLRTQLACQRFGERYDAARGIVPLGQPLCDELLPIPAARRADPDIAFFAAANPGHVAGDELVCLASLSRDNLTPAGWRMFEAGRMAAHRS